MSESSRFAKSLKSPFQWTGAGLILLILLAIAMGPGPTLPHENMSLQKAHAICVAMFKYANNHNGNYPTGKSSTEVFQKLIEGDYLTDPDIFWDETLHIPGEIKATSNVLKPENVCFDVTVPVDENSPDLLPVVFSTGYKIDYVPNGTASPLFSSSQDRPRGIAVTYHSNSAVWVKDDGLPDRKVTGFIDPQFDPAGKKYRQLSPDGPLP